MFGVAAAAAAEMNFLSQEYFVDDSFPVVALGEGVVEEVFHLFPFWLKNSFDQYPNQNLCPRFYRTTLLPH
jgi:hypothetical protein